jgi:hypothetical protein
LGKFLFGSGEADLEPFDFAEPAFAFGFGDVRGQVVTEVVGGVAKGTPVSWVDQAGASKGEVE